MEDACATMNANVMPVKSFMTNFEAFEKPYAHFENSMLGNEFVNELQTVSRLWFQCGYRPGIAAYLNFFLLTDFITTHDRAHPPRFMTFRSMADSFYKTDLFIRDLSDSGKEPTGGISSRKVRGMLQGMMKRHQRVSIPDWMMTYFGFSLLENVEKQCLPLSKQEKRWHLAYMSKAYRIMGFPFSENRELLERFARDVEEGHAGVAAKVLQHTRHILCIGEMIGVSSRWEDLSPMLPEKTRLVFQEIYEEVKPGPFKVLACRVAGKLFMKRAAGEGREAMPVRD